MTYTYSIINPFPKDRRFVWLESLPSSIQKTWKLTEAVSMYEDFPPDAEFPIDPQRGDLLPDIVPNVFNVLIVSSRIRSIFTEEAIDDIEYLPLIILDKKGRVKSDTYCVANLIGSVDCLDVANSIYKDDSLEKGQIRSIHRLNLLHQQIPQDIRLFRLTQRRYMFLIRNDLLKKLRDQDVTGLETFGLGIDLFIP